MDEDKIPLEVEEELKRIRMAEGLSVSEDSVEEPVKTCCPFLKSVNFLKKMFHLIIVKIKLAWKCINEEANKVD